MRWAVPSTLWVLVVGASTACTNVDPTGAADPAYLLIEAEVRASGAHVQVDGRPHLSALPTELDAWASQVVVIADWGRRDVSLRPGHLSYVRGSDSRVEVWELEREVRTDVLRLTTSEEDAARLAAALGTSRPVALATRPVAAIDSPEQWWLEGPDAFVRLAWMGEQPAVAEASPALQPGVVAPSSRDAHWLGTALDGASRSLADRALPITANAPDPELVPGDTSLAGFVGLYQSGRVRLLLDAQGGFTWFESRPCSERARARRGAYRRNGENLILDGEITLEPQSGGALFDGRNVFSEAAP